MTYTALDMVGNLEIRHGAAFSRMAATTDCCTCDAAPAQVGFPQESAMILGVCEAADGYSRAAASPEKAIILERETDIGGIGPGRRTG
jgi:hypothetical protein